MLLVSDSYVSDSHVSDSQSSEFPNKPGDFKRAIENVNVQCLKNLYPAMMICKFGRFLFLG
uniref:Uncharacterized protein n=1 Tax=Romanomermis culicivorax TaxID=13658 RepID=A0A915I9Q5_ROMCU